MQINQLEVTNFRCFEHLTLDLHPEFNVLIGENGAGKTSILEALEVAVGDWLRDLGDLPTRHIDTDDIRLVGRRVGDETTFEPQTPILVVARGRVGGLPAKWMRTFEGGDAALKATAREVARRVQVGETVTLPLVAYYGVGRLWLSREDDGVYSPPMLLTPRELSRLEGYRDALSARTSAQELTRWLAYQDYVAYQEKHESPVYQAVLTAMRGMVERATDVRFDAKRLELVVEFERGDVQPFAHLSDGQRNMLALAGDIAMRMARLNPQFGADVLKETPGVVLIDELDLHLHPRWQRHVVEDLRRTFPKIQFITTTHSPQIISEVQPESVIVLSRDGEKTVALRAHQTYGLDTNGVLQRLMDDPGRPIPAQVKIDAVDDAIEEGDLDEAREILKQLRHMLHGDDPEVVRLDTSIYALEALADAVD
jgi:predicted ATP-binding protein involved in virulence